MVKKIGISMRNTNEFEIRLSPSLRAQFRALKSPTLIQSYLDELPYIAEELDRSPLRVMTDHQGHCLDGGIFGALALSQLGYQPLIMDLVPEPGLDDDHVLAVFFENGCWGCIAKSNYPVLRYREPVYRSLRELSMTYFDFYFNSEKKKSLRAYTIPLNLSQFPNSWMWDEKGISLISKHLYQRKPIKLITSELASTLKPGDEKTYKAASLGTDFNWIFGVRENP
jgi:hypothetical protein